MVAGLPVGGGSGLRFGCANGVLNPLREVAFAISNETPKLGVAGPCSGLTVPFKGALRQAEDFGRLRLIEKRVHCVLPLPKSWAELSAAQICWEDLASLAMKNTGKFNHRGDRKSVFKRANPCRCLDEVTEIQRRGCYLVANSLAP